MKNFLSAIGIIALLIAGAALYAAVSPLFGNVDALTLTNDITQTQQQQAPQTVYIVATPTLAPAAPAYVPVVAVATAVPVIVNEVQPAPEPAEPMVNIAAGTASEAQAQFLADCAYGQATGLRVSPSCPDNAGVMLGQGR